MPDSRPTLSRRDFLKLAALGALGAMAYRPLERILPLPEVPQSEFIARNCIGGKSFVRSYPQATAPIVREIYEDTLLPWVKVINATSPDIGRYNQHWVEVNDGYVYGPDFQKTRNLPNTPLTEMPKGADGNPVPGFWAEVTVPYVDFVLENAPASPWLKDAEILGLPTRLYYSQVMWIDQIKVSENTGNIIYRINERYGSFGDLMWAEGAAFRPLTADELSPISPDVDPAEKTVVANLTYQTLSCFEGKREVFFCRMSSGAKWDAFGNPVPVWSTPIGEHWTWRKSISIHMAGGTVGGSWDTPGVSWTTLFSGTGVAIHSTFWHNDYGNPRSHGCLNVLPEDAKWIFRWSTPYVSLADGDITIQGQGGTVVKVQERIV